MLWFGRGRRRGEYGWSRVGREGNDRILELEVILEVFLFEFWV